MNINDIPKGNQSNSVPENFFEDQFQSILRKTTELENWQLAGSKDLEKNFQVPDGFWLQMEDGIRARSKPNAKPGFALYPRLQWAAAVGLLLIISIAVSQFWNINKVQSDNWSAKIETASSDELIAVLDLERADIQELTEQIVAKSLSENELNIQNERINYDEAERTFQDLNVNEIYENFEFN